MSKQRKFFLNFEFPAFFNDLKIAEYRIERLPDYSDRVQKLQHPITIVRSGEGTFERKSGENAVTAFVDLPEKEEKSILPWTSSTATALDDVVLLLAIFTGREITLIDEDLPAIDLMFIDRRVHLGDILRWSLKLELEEIRIGGQRDAGLEKGINAIYARMRDPAWQKKFRKGHFLFLVRHLMRLRFLEEKFTASWTIWEHLFATHNESWLSVEQIISMPAIEKISFLLVTYAVKEEIGKTDRDRIRELANIRNRLVHAGRFPEQDDVYNDAKMFVNMTEFIVAKILGLEPSDPFSTIQAFEKFLKKEVKKGQKKAKTPASKSRREIPSPKPD